MRIYEDTTSGAAWHYCFGCKHSGDMVDLAAAVWQVTHHTAIHKLADSGLPLPLEQADTYLAARDRRTQWAGMWDRAKETMATTHSQNIHGLRHRMGLNVTCSQERWRDGPGMLLGALHFKEVFAALMPGSVNAAGFSGRLFKGPRWGEVLLTPYYNLHDRIVGFAFCGRKGTNKKDRVWHFNFKGRGKCDAGLAGMWTVEASNAMFAQFYVALEDPWFMLKLQLRHFATSAAPLPLVAWHDDGLHVTSKTWGHLTGRVPVFWVRDEVLPARTLHQAIISDGHLSFSRMENHTARTDGHYVRNNEPRELVRKMLKRSQPWKQALVEWVEDAPHGPVEDLLNGLAGYGHDMYQIADLSPKLKALLSLPAPAREARFTNHGRVVEKEGRWWHKTTKGCELIMDGMLRVDATTVKEMKGRDVVCYKGRLLFDGREIPFELPMTVLRHYGADKIRELSVKATGKMVYIAPSFRGRLIEAANAFSKPLN